MTLFFNDNCVCERAGDIISHLVFNDKCLKTETEIKNFKDQVISIIHKIAQEKNQSNENERERVDPQDFPNNPFPQPNPYDCALGELKHSTVLKLIDKKIELDTKNKI